MESMKTCTTIDLLKICTDKVQDLFKLEQFKLDTVLCSNEFPSEELLAQMKIDIQLGVFTWSLPFGYKMDLFIDNFVSLLKIHKMVLNVFTIANET